MYSFITHSDTGGEVDPSSGKNRNEFILQFNPADGSWTQVGQLKVARNNHGASVINSDDIIDYCD